MKTILFLHGFYASGSCIPANALKEAFEGKVRVLSPDLPLHPKEALEFIQMLMFLTRLGLNSKMVVNGDLTQIDLNISKTKSGLTVANNSLRNIKGISFLEFEKSDIVRNPLVEKIIEKLKD